MRVSHSVFKRIANFGVFLMMGVSMSADAGLFGIGGTSWKEEVLLHDGSKIVVKRSQSYGGRHEIGQTPPIKEQEITFTIPSSGERITWKSEYGEDVGRSNFILLALHILRNTPYIVANPNLCLSYNKWGRPNPPYVIFKYEGKEWKRIPLQELPVEFKDINLVVSTKAEEKTIADQSLVSAELVKKLNGSLDQPEYRSILREPLPKERINQMCMEMTLYKGYWIMPNDPAARAMVDGMLNRSLK
ncbi:MAG: hypothetical protein WCV99_23905 [Sterolibacterium sp.]